MNAKQILDQLMRQASGAGRQGGNGQGGGFDLGRVVEGLGLGGTKGSTGGSALGGLDVKSLLGGGGLGLLLGSKRGRSMGGKALKLGAIAAVGGLAWKAWQNAQANRAGTSQPSSSESSESSEGQPIEALEGEAQERRSQEILQAIIMAARADGHIDDQERALITQHFEAAGADQQLNGWLIEQLQAPLDAEALARQADSPQAAREIYLASVAVVDEENPQERAWLDRLASALALDPAVASEIERQARAAA
ncbi:tellurite resistance TerB family protein [Halotalea alkalilenta]|uniref:tellurite resistance TerB family protein n=1 Tax=Halotalea alkalilenta TaxID=376489 RepID=UPI0004807B2B|nr:tellurite resistance TerB family protein [Halotalea alkalilenta]